MELDAEAILKAAGLQLLKPKAAEPFTGLTLEAGKSMAEVVKVERDSPAWQADFSVGDQIIAVDGLQLQTELSERLKDFAAGTTVKVTLFRDGRLLERQLTPLVQPAGSWQITPVAKPSREQKAYYQAWLGMEIPAAK